MELHWFSAREEEMIRLSLEALQKEGYDVGPFQILIRTDMPPGKNAMTLADGAALGKEAFRSQALFAHRQC